MKETPIMINNNRKRNTFSVVLITILVIALVVTVFFGTYLWQQKQVSTLESQLDQLRAELIDAQRTNSTLVPTSSYTSTKGVVVKVFIPEKDTTTTGPLVVMGQVPGNWSFEASFPVAIKDPNGDLKQQVSASIIGDWMTSELVPFVATIEYDSTLTGDMELILQKDNPSGLSENDDSVTIPLKFK